MLSFAVLPNSDLTVKTKTPHFKILKIILDRFNDKVYQTKDIRCVLGFIMLKIFFLNTWALRFPTMYIITLM